MEDVLEGKMDRKSRALRSCAKTMFTEKQILEFRCRGYQKAIQTEQKKRQRQKPLFKQLGSVENGGAIFYSPKKVQEARDLITEKEAEERRLARAKEEAKIQRAIEKD